MSTPLTSNVTRPNQLPSEEIVLNEQSDSRNRERIALGVLLASIVAVVLVSIGVIWTAKDTEKASQRVMDSTLPLYGTWVGTILAFYFSRNAFESASNATVRNAFAFQQASSGLVSMGTPLDSTLAKIPLKALANNLVFSQDDVNKPLEEVVNDLLSKNRYRTIVIDSGIKYVDLVYRINAEAFLVQFQPQTPNPSVENSLQKPTLRDYLDWRHGQGENAQPIVVFLPENATLADADTKIKETIGCRDIVVTTDGQNTSPVVVYVTDIDINEYKQ